MPVRRIPIDQRRARLAIRHHLAPPARSADVTEVARDRRRAPAPSPSTSAAELQLLAEGGIAEDPAAWLERAEAMALEIGIF